MVRRFVVTGAGLVLFLCATAAAQEYPLPEGVKNITTQELKGLFDRKEKFLLVNSLSPLEFTQTKIRGSVNVPYGHLRDGVKPIPGGKSDTLIFYCLGPG